MKGDLTVKKLFIASLTALMIIGLTACGAPEYNPPMESTPPAVESDGGTEDHSTGGTEDTSDVYSCLYKCKEDIHEELFDKQTLESQLVIDLLFEELEVEPIESKFHEDGILVTAKVTNINAGIAVVQVFKEYAMLCAENAFSTNPMSNTALYEEYADMLADAFEEAGRVTRTVTILMEKKHDIWVCDLDEIAMDAITGNLFSAMVIEAIIDTGVTEEINLNNEEELAVKIEVYRSLYNLDDNALAMALIQDGYAVKDIFEALNQQ